MEAPNGARAPASNARSSRQRFILRGVAGLAFLAATVTLVWGAVWQQPRHNPFETPGLLLWLLTPEPDQGYREIPVLPLGSRLSLASRDLCTESEQCRLNRMAGGQIRFRDSTGAEQTAARLHLSSSGHLFALTSSG